MRHGIEMAICMSRQFGNADAIPAKLATPTPQNTVFTAPIIVRFSTGKSSITITNSVNSMP